MPRNFRRERNKSLSKKFYSLDAKCRVKCKREEREQRTQLIPESAIVLYCIGSSLLVSSREVSGCWGWRWAQPDPAAKQAHPRTGSRRVHHAHRHVGLDRLRPLMLNWALEQSRSFTSSCNVSLWSVSLCNRQVRKPCDRGLISSDNQGWPSHCHTHQFL